MPARGGKEADGRYARRRAVLTIALLPRKRSDTKIIKRM